MPISRRNRRTDLREGSLDIDNIFVNATLDQQGKIILSNAAAVSWNVLETPFSQVTVGGKTQTNTYPHQIQLIDEDQNSFDIQKETNSTSSINNSYLLKLFINGLKIDSSFSINQNILFFELTYPIESDDIVTLWYVAV